METKSKRLLMRKSMKDAPGYGPSQNGTKCKDCLFAHGQHCELYDFEFTTGYTCDAWQPQDGGTDAAPAPGQGQGGEAVSKIVLKKASVTAGASNQFTQDPMLMSDYAGGPAQNQKVNQATMGDVKGVRKIRLAYSDVRKPTYEGGEAEEQKRNQLQMVKGPTKLMVKARKPADYWRTVAGHKVPFGGTPGSGTPLVKMPHERGNGGAKKSTSTSGASETNAAPQTKKRAEGIGTTLKRIKREGGSSMDVRADVVKHRAMLKRKKAEAKTADKVMKHLADSFVLAGQHRVIRNKSSRNVDTHYSAGLYAIDKTKGERFTVTHKPSGLSVGTHDEDEAKRLADHMHKHAGNAGDNSKFGQAPHPRTNDGKAIMNAYDSYKNPSPKATKRAEQTTKSGSDSVVHKQVKRAQVIQARMKSENKIVKSKKLTEKQKIDKLVSTGHTEESAKDLMAPDFAGRIGHPGYRLTNNNARIKRLQKKAEKMSKATRLVIRNRMLNMRKSAVMPKPIIEADDAVSFQPVNGAWSLRGYHFEYRQGQAGVGVLTVTGPKLSIPFHVICQGYPQAKQKAPELLKQFESGVVPDTGVYRKIDATVAKRRPSYGGLKMMKAVVNKQDLMKAFGHKYKSRKRKGNRWVYEYDDKKSFMERHKGKSMLAHKEAAERHRDMAGTHHESSIEGTLNSDEYIKNANMHAHHSSMATAHDAMATAKQSKARGEKHSEFRDGWNDRAKHHAKEAADAHARANPKTPDDRLLPTTGRQWVEKLNHLPDDTLQHYTQKDGTIEPERAKMHDEWLAGMFADAPTPQSGKKTAIIMMGGTASGKSTITKHIDRSQFVVCDADDIKQKIPEYKEAVQGNAKNAAGMAHEESSMLVKRLRDKAVDNGKNVLMDGTGKNLDKYKSFAKKLKSEGYHVTLIMADLDVETALIRAGDRSERSGRSVNESFINEAYAEIPHNFIPMTGEVDDFQLFDNRDGGVGLAWSRKDGTEKVHNKSFVDSFHMKYNKGEGEAMDKSVKQNKPRSIFKPDELTKMIEKALLEGEAKWAKAPKLFPRNAGIEMIEDDSAFE